MLLTGGLSFMGGLALLPLVAVSGPLKGLLAISWIALCGFEGRALWRGYAGCHALRIAAGGHVERQAPDGSWQAARLCAGSVVLARVAWLRIAGPGERPFAELVGARSHSSEEWRRLQVVWRHIGGA